MKGELTELLENYSRSDRSGLIPALQDIQEKFGYLSEEDIVGVGKYFNMPSSKVFGLATFYNQFRFEPKGKYHIEICTGTACYVEGVTSLLDHLEQITKGKKQNIGRGTLFSIEVVPCIGACAFAPVFMVNGKMHAKLTINKISEIIDSYINSEDSND